MNYRRELEPKREMSSFFFKELMYDFVSDQLDEDRKSSMEDFLAKNQELKEELGHLSQAMDYCQELSQASVDPRFIEQLSPRSMSSKLLSAAKEWRDWPISIKWGMEALTVSAALLVLFLVAPWAGVFDQISGWMGSSEAIDVVQVEKEAVKLPTPEELRRQSSFGPGESQSEDESIDVAAAAEPEPSTVEAVVEVEEDESEVADEASDESTDVVAAVQEERPAKIKKGPQGFVFYGSLRVKDHHAVSDALVELIQKEGGEKAGQVELGWRKSDGERYFHFQIPEPAYDRVIEFLQAKSDNTIRIRKNAHRRVMPEGTQRIILRLNEAR